MICSACLMRFAICLVLLSSTETGYCPLIWLYWACKSDKVLPFFFVSESSSSSPAKLPALSGVWFIATRCSSIFSMIMSEALPTSLMMLTMVSGLRLRLPNQPLRYWALLSKIFRSKPMVLPTRAEVISAISSSCAYSFVPAWPKVLFRRLS